MELSTNDKAVIENLTNGITELKRSLVWMENDTLPKLTKVIESLCKAIDNLNTTMVGRPLG